MLSLNEGKEQLLRYAEYLEQEEGRHKRRAFGILGCAIIAGGFLFLTRKPGETWKIITVTFSPEELEQLKGLDFYFGAPALEVPPCYIPIAGGQYIAWDTPLFGGMNYVCAFPALSTDEIPKNLKVNAFITLDGKSYSDYITDELLNAALKSSTIAAGTSAAVLSGGIAVGLIGSVASIAGVSIIAAPIAVAAIMVYTVLNQSKIAEINEEILNENIKFLFLQQNAYTAQLNVMKSLVEQNLTLLFPEDKAPVLTVLDEELERLNQLFNALPLDRKDGDFFVPLSVADLIPISDALNTAILNVQRILGETSLMRSVRKTQKAQSAWQSKVEQFPLLEFLQGSGFAAKEKYAFTVNDSLMGKSMLVRFGLLNIMDTIGVQAVQEKKNFIFLLPSNVGNLRIKFSPDTFSPTQKQAFEKLSAESNVLTIGPLAKSLFRTYPARTFIGDSSTQAINHTVFDRVTMNLKLSTEGFFGCSLITREFERIDLDEAIQFNIKREQLATSADNKSLLTCISTGGVGAWTVTNDGYSVESGFVIRSDFPFIVESGCVNAIDVNGTSPQALEAVKRIRGQGTAAAQTLRILTTLFGGDSSFALFLQELQKGGLDLCLGPILEADWDATYPIGIVPKTLAFAPATSIRKLLPELSIPPGAQTSFYIGLNREKLPFTKATKLGFYPYIFNLVKQDWNADVFNPQAADLAVDERLQRIRESGDLLLRLLGNFSAIAKNYPMLEVLGIRMRDATDINVDLTVPCEEGIFSSVDYSLAAENDPRFKFPENNAAKISVKLSAGNMNHTWCSAIPDLVSSLTSRNVLVVNGKIPFITRPPSYKSPNQALSLTAGIPVSVLESIFAQSFQPIVKDEELPAIAVGFGARIQCCIPPVDGSGIPSCSTSVSWDNRCYTLTGFTQLSASSLSPRANLDPVQRRKFFLDSVQLGYNLVTTDGKQQNFGGFTCGQAYPVFQVPDNSYPQWQLYNSVYCRTGTGCVASGSEDDPQVRLTSYGTFKRRLLYGLTFNERS